MAMLQSAGRTNLVEKSDSPASSSDGVATLAAFEKAEDGMELKPTASAVALSGSEDERGKSEQQAESSHVLQGWRLGTLVASIFLAIFCVAIDNTILSTAIPRITDTYHTTDDIGWYGAAYLLTSCGCQILYARIYLYFDVKWVFLAALLIFEIGSTLSATASTSAVFVGGRAVAGLGAAGLFTGAAAAIVHVAPIDKRPFLSGLMGGVFGLSSIIAPLIGGAITDGTTWRWCFYINLPIGGVAALGVLLLLRTEQQLEKLRGSILSRLAVFDPFGNVLFLATIICLLMALQWGGATYPYGDRRIIALFTLFGVFLLAWIGSQVLNQKHAMVPGRVIKNRSVACGAFFGFCLGGSMFTLVYYLPVWFQGIQGVSALTSAVHYLPWIFVHLTGSILAGALTNRLGYYMPFVVLACVLTPIGSGLLTTFTPHTSTGKWVGYQLICGLGYGAGFYQANLAAITVLPKKDAPTGGAIAFSSLSLGGAIFLNVAQGQFSKHLLHSLAQLQIPDFDYRVVLRSGALQLRTVVPEAYRPQVLAAYNDAIVKNFQIACIVACLATLGAVGMQWVNVKKKDVDTADDTVVAA